MKRLLAILVLGVCVSACSSSATSPSATTKIIGLSGNLAFGTVTVGQQADATLTITNSGNATLTVTGMVIPTSVITASFANGTIPAGGSQLVVLQFAPTNAVFFDGTLTVNGDQTSGTNTIAISGAATLN